MPGWWLMIVSEFRDVHHQGIGDIFVDMNDGWLMIYGII
jgi:hypothetical protein